MSELVEKLTGVAKSFLKLAQDERERDQELSYRYFQICETCRKAAQELMRMEPVDPEYEGGQPTWFFVCGECHTALDPKDKFCRECGRRIKWK